MLKTEISQRITKLVYHEMDMKQHDFARACKISPQTLSNLATGKNKLSFDTLRNMLLAFPRLNVRWLMFGKGPVWLEGDGEKYVVVEEQEEFKKRCIECDEKQAVINSLVESNKEIRELCKELKDRLKKDK